ncbi:MAG TPA: TolC family protein [Terracidiphilus sp.]|nr:TolC family protein [Terracidiphilus sp.]
MKRGIHFGFPALEAPVLCVAMMLAAGTFAGAQSSNPSSAAYPFYGSVTLRPATDETLQLSLDDAVRRGLENNLGLREAENSENLVKGEKNEALQEFLPTVTVSGGTGIFQHNLAALGFGPSALKEFSSFFPGGKPPAGFTAITKDDLTQGQINYSQILFSGPVIAGWRAAGAATRAAHFAKMSARGEVVQQVATAYLHAIAAASEVDEATAQERADRVLFDQAHAAHEAGTVANLDELRARVQLQAQQQAVIAAQNSLDKDLILLKREIGIDPGQNIVLTDATPYSDLASQTPEEVRATAYKNRQDYQNLQNQLVEVKAIHAVYRYQRLPTLTFGGYWGIDKVNGTGSHDVFAAQGSLSFPIFSEGRLRGEEQSAAAQLASVNAQLQDLREHIDQQVRSALLDVDAASKLVQVSRSNVDLATRALSDETERVNAGVDDNLPLVDAQATLASAQSSLIESLYQYNVSKLALARAAGVLEQQYRAYLGR